MFNRLFWLMLAWCLSARGAEKVFDFSTTPTNQTPSGFRSALAGTGRPGDWKVILDEVPSLFAPLSDKAPALAKHAVLAQLDDDPTDERFPLCIFNGETFSDFTITTQFKLASGKTEQMAGIAFRLQDEKNFYVIRASGLGNNVRFYKVINGERSTPIGPEILVEAKTWHELKIECKGNKIQAWFDGKQVLLPLTDNSFKAGKIAFWTKSDAVTYFTNTKIVYTPRIPLAQTVVQQSLKKYDRLKDLKIYTTDENGEPRVSGCKDAADLGSAGGKAEKDCIQNGSVYYGKDRDAVSVVMPLRDRNGDPIAAVRMRMETFIGQTEQNALARARPVIKEMQAQVQSLDDLTQ